MSRDTINTVDYNDLTDIREVNVDRNLSKAERVREYVRQIKDPYHFKCGKFIVTAQFAANGPTLEDCLGRLLA